jgi:hypothetical protein
MHVNLALLFCICPVYKATFVIPCCPNLLTGLFEKTVTTEEQPAELPLAGTTGQPYQVGQLLVTLATK